MRGHLVGEHKVCLLDDLGGELAESLVLLTELGAALLGGGVDTKDHSQGLIGMGEGVEELITLLLIVLALEHVATVSPPGGLGHFVIEEAGGESLAPLL
jgi:hypothetical protein